MLKAIDLIKNINKKDAEIIDRYVYDVTRKVGHDQEELQKELLYNIEEMLDDNLDRENIVRVLKELGNPSYLALQYKKDAQYLISPITYLDYIRILKLVFVIITVAITSIGVISELVEAEFLNYLNICIIIIKNVVTGLATGALNAFFWVTITFIIIDRYAQKNNYDWDIDDLPELSEDTKSFNIASTITGLVFTILFSSIFIIIALFKPNMIAWYSANEAIPLFNSEVLFQFIPAFIIIAISSIIISILKLYYKKWNKKIFISYFVYNILSTIVILLFVNNDNLINETFISKLAHFQGNNIEQVMSWIDIGVMIVSFSIIVIFIFEIYDAIKNTYRK